MMKSIALDLSDPKKRILEVGCGAGGFSIFASKMNGHVTGLDIGKTRVNMANKLKNHFGGFGGFAVGDAQHLPFKNGSQDIVICSETLEHVPNYFKAFNELVRVTKNLGYIIITVPNNISLAQLDKFSHFISCFANGRSQPKDLHVFNGFVINNLFKRKDLKIQTKAGADLFYIPSPRPRIQSFQNKLNLLMGRYFHRFSFLCLNIGIVARKKTE